MFTRGYFDMNNSSMHYMTFSQRVVFFVSLLENSKSESPNQNSSTCVYKYLRLRN